MWGLFLILFGVAAAHIFAMVVFEDLSLSDAIWLTLTTMTTVGYGDMSAQTGMGRFATILLMYGIGIFLLAQIAGEWIDFRMNRRERMRKGLWRWNMKNHIVIVNSPERDGVRYLRMLVEQIRNTPVLEDLPIQVFSDSFSEGLPNEIAQWGVALHHGQPEGRDMLGEVDVEQADFIIVMAVNTQSLRSDSLTLDVLDKLSRYKLAGHVIAECVQDENRERFLRHGANAVIRPMRAYPELMVRAMAAPGTEMILEDLFTHEGVHPKRYDLAIPSQPWGELAARLLLAGLGTPIGYLNADQRVITNPEAGKQVDGTAIFLMVNQDTVPSVEDIQDCMVAG
jgi:voltage-gated potassium channel